MTTSTPTKPVTPASAPIPHEADEVGTRPVAPRPSFFRLIFFVVLLGGVLAGLYSIGAVPRMHKSEALASGVERVKNALPRVQVIIPKRAPENVTAIIPGDVQAMEETMLFPRTSGYLRKWHVDIGDTVEAGQLLAEIDAPEVTKELAQAQASLQLLKAKLATAISTQNLAEITLNRNTALSNGAISKQQFDESKASADTASTMVESAKADIAVGEANVNRIQEMDSFSKVIAPFAGTITARDVDVGQLVVAGNSAGQAMFRLARTNPVRVFVNVPQIYAPGVKTGMAAQILVRELPGETFTGKVTRTAGAIDPITRTLRTEIQVPNDAGKLLVGSYVQAKIEVHRQNPPLLVPASSLIFNADGMRLATVDDQDIVHLRPVVVDGDFGTELGIAHGIEPTDHVVSNPGDRLLEGMHVTQTEKK